jgi:hypothetical protein
MTPIETNYKGIRFRSRLEARWAVFFDKLGLKYQYEAEGYKLKGDDGKEVFYLPDFFVPVQENWFGAWYFEVKPSTKLSEEEVLKALVQESKISLAILTLIPDPDEIDDFREDYSVYTYVEGTGGGGVVGASDISYFFCSCPFCPALGFEYCSRSERIKCGCQNPNDKNYHTGPIIRDAVEAARSARFEKGDSWR